MFMHKHLIGSGIVFASLALAASGGLVGERVAAAGDNAAQKGASDLSFEIYQDRAMEFRWRLKAANGEIMATSGQGHKAKTDCKQAIERIQTDAEEDKLRFEVYEDRAGGHRWRLKAANGQVIGVSSEGYKSKADCQKATDAIQRGAATAEVKDST